MLSWAAPPRALVRHCVSCSPPVCSLSTSFSVSSSSCSSSVFSRCCVLSPPSSISSVLLTHLGVDALKQLLGPQPSCVQFLDTARAPRRVQPRGPCAPRHLSRGSCRTGRAGL